VGVESHRLLTPTFCFWLPNGRLCEWRRAEHNKALDPLIEGLLVWLGNRDLGSVEAIGKPHNGLALLLEVLVRPSIET
jgi:hypothetical protein